MPIIFGLVLIFIIWFQFKKRKTAKEIDTEKDSFLKRENEANLTRKKDISTLAYIKLPMEGLPLTKGSDNALNQFIETYLLYLDKKIINLSHYSNTELKEQYGLANLSILSQYDENFFSLTKLLNDWGNYLLEINLLNEASQVLNLAVSIKTEITESYVNLATVYSKQQSPQRIADVKFAYSSLSDQPSEKVIALLNQLVFQSLVESDS